MGQIVVSVAETGQNIVDTKVNIADADVGRIVAAYQDAADKQKAIDYPPEPPDPETPPGELVPPVTATRDEVLAYWARSILNYSNNQITNYEREQQTVALPPVSPIEPLTMTRKVQR